MEGKLLKNKKLNNTNAVHFLALYITVKIIEEIIIFS